MWQGWVALGLFGAVLIGAPLFAPSVAIPATLAAAGALIAVCFLKGERTGWRWGEGKDSQP